MRENRRHATLIRVLAALVAVAVAVTLGSGPSRSAAATLPYQDPDRPVAERVDDLLGRMTLVDKLGQMTQAERAGVRPDDVTGHRLGSVLSGGGSAPTPNTPAAWADMYDAYQRGALATPLGIPLLYGLDAVHGDNNVYGSTIFPHNIGLGATRDPALVEQIGQATAEEVTGAGLDWTFAPCLCVARNDRWGRTYESFGEDPALATAMTSVITGLQDGPAPILAIAKHYVGDGGTTGGVDQGDTEPSRGEKQNATPANEISEAELRAIHLPPFKAAVDRGVASVMISFSSWNGLKMHAGKFLITDVLKGELGFTGFTVSDWAAIDQLDGKPGFTEAEVVTAVNAGLDMLMVPENWTEFLGYLRDAVQTSRIPMSRIDDATRRILTEKFRFGLFEHPYADRALAGTIGSAAHRALARQAVRESQVLLKNDDGVLPLAKTGGKIFVAGKNAADLGNQSGGWTLTWQGAGGDTVPGTTILQGIQDAAGAGTTVTYARDGTGIDGTYRAAIAVVGETPYAEGKGDRPGSLGLDAADLATLARLRASDVPVIVVLVSGRPLDIAGQLSDWDALLAAWLPGSEGAGVADVLFGDYSPTGRLPVTWPRSAGQEPINDGDQESSVRSGVVAGRSDGKTGVFAYGYGLTYPDSAPEVAAPSVPGTPLASAATATGLTLSWTPSTGSGGIDGYDLYRDGTLIACAMTTRYAVTGLTAGTPYSFTVVARDKAGNRSPASSAVMVTTAPAAKGG